MKVIALSMLVAGAAAAELKLHASTKTHVHAEYNGLAAEIKHLGEKSGISRIYDVATGENFIQVKNIDGQNKVQFFDNEPMEFDSESTPNEYGEQSAKFNTHPKMQLLAELSEELGKSDAEHSVAYWVHSLALRQGKMAANADTELVQEEEEEEAQAGWGRRRRRRRLRSIGNSINKCGNACFGACGPGCTEWNWVCGDNKAYRGCWEHDCHCSCSWWKMAHPKCIGFTAHSDTCNVPGCAAFQCSKSAIDC